MTRRHDPAVAWVVGATGGALALAVVLLACRGTGPDGLALAIRMTARWSFLFFWFSYTGGAMTVLFGRAFDGVAQRARSLGLAFAAALMVHLGLVAWLGIAIGQMPLQGGVLWFFLLAAFFAGSLTLLSFGIAARRLGRLWRPLLLLSTTYILIAFGRDFVGGVFDPRTQHWPFAAEYVPFALLSVAAIPLRMVAFIRRRVGVRRVAPAARLDQEHAACL